MKLACASGAFSGAISNGDLTQFEFLDACAGELACDGVVLDTRHFPRTDGDYLAQVKKMAADRGLTIAALADAAFFGADGDGMRAALDCAAAVGAPLLAAPLGRDTNLSWSEQLGRLNSATSLAKAVNVTLAVRNAPGSFASTAHDCKRVSKEADSAWLRFGLDPAALDAINAADIVGANAVLLWSGVAEATPHAARELAGAFPAFRGHLTLDDPSGNATIAEMRNAMHVWRIALAELVLNRT
jgi:sugar phosphate isomerase/epimerase